MKNVCRTILLHDEFIPAMAGNRDWKYQVLGHHDGMSVGNATHLDEMVDIVCNKINETSDRT